MIELSVNLPTLLLSGLLSGLFAFTTLWCVHVRFQYLEKLLQKGVDTTKFTPVSPADLASLFEEDLPLDKGIDKKSKTIDERINEYNGHMDMDF